MNDKMLALNGNDPWDKFPDESDLWFERFFQYMLLGPSRSIPQLMQNIGASANSASSYYAASKKFAWKQRAQSWDVLQQERELQAVQDARIQNKLKRTKFLEKLLEKLDSAIDIDLNLDMVTWQTIGPVTKSLMDALRMEYEDGAEANQQIQDVSFTLNINKPISSQTKEDDDDMNEIIDIG